MRNCSRDLFGNTDNFSKYKGVKSNLISGNIPEKAKSVSITIPTYRRPHKLQEALESALKQLEYDDYDIIIIDNDPERGCPSEKLVLDFKDPKIRYYKNEKNIGMVGNWNRCYELSSSEWVVMLHDDDLLCEDYLKTISQLFAYNFHILTASNFSWDMRSSDSFTPPVQNPKRRKLFKFKTYDFLFGFPVGAPLGMAAKSSFVKGIGGFDDKFYPSFDYAFFVKASKYGNIGKILNYNLGIYRYEVNETLNFSNLEKFVEMDYRIKLMILEELGLNYLKPFFVKIFDSYRANYISNSIKSFGYGENELNWEFLKKTAREKPRLSVIKSLYRYISFFRNIKYRLQYSCDLSN